MATDRIFWMRLQEERQQRILLTVRVAALEEHGRRPSVLIEAPRTLQDWFELIRSFEKLIIWLLPRFILPAWGFIQSLWPWLQTVGIPYLRQLVGF